jgi:hypothetical protein
MRIPRLVQDTRRAAQQAIVQCDKGAGEVSHFACQPAFRTTFSTLRWLRFFFGQHPAECTIGYLDLRLGEYGRRLPPLQRDWSSGKRCIVAG